MYKKFGILLVISSLTLPLNSAILIRGDKDAPEGQTFSFNVNKNIFSTSGNFYEASNEIITANQEFTLSRLVRNTAAFAPLMPQLVTLNGNPETPNPLFGDKIIALGMLETEDGFVVRDMPVVVPETRPANVYLFENITQFDNTVIVTSGDVHDATGAVSSGIVNLTTNIANYVFAAAKPNNGEFGDLNSGIALLIRGIIEDTDATKKEYLVK